MITKAAKYSIQLNLLWIISLILIHNGYAASKPKMAVLPFIPEAGQTYDGTGPALQYLLENVIALHTDLDEFRLHWQIDHVFPNIKIYLDYCRGISVLPEIDEAGHRLKIRYWLYGKYIHQQEGTTVSLRLKDLAADQKEHKQILFLGPEDSLLELRKKFLAWLKDCRLPLPTGQADKALWPEPVPPEGLASLGLAYNNYCRSFFTTPGKGLDHGPFDQALRKGVDSYLALCLSGWFFYYQKNHLRASEQFTAALKENAYGVDAMDGLLGCAVRSGNKKEAFRWGEKKALTRGDSLLIGRAAAASAIAKEAYKKNDYQKAKKYFAKALETGRRIYHKNHSETANACSNIGTVSYAEGDFVRALDHYEQALVIRQEILGKAHPDIATAHNNIGLTYYNLGNYHKATAHHEKALAIRMSALEPNNLDTASSHNNLGSSRYESGDYVKALEHYEKGLTIRLQALGPAHLDTALSYHNMGVAYLKMSAYATALACHQKALAIRLNALGPDHHLTALSYHEISAVYEDMGSYSEALKNYQKVLTILTGHPGPKGPTTAACYQNIGSVYQAMGDPALALENHEKALAIRKKVLGPHHPSTGSSYNSIGTVQYTLGAVEKAIAYHEKALAIQLQALGPAHPITALSYYNLSAIYYAEGADAEALEYAQTVLPVAETSAYGELKWRAWHLMSKVQARQGQPKAAIFFGKKAVNAIQSMRRQSSTLEREWQRSFMGNKASAYRELAGLLVKQGLPAEAQYVIGLLKEEEYFDFIRRDPVEAKRLPEKNLLSTAEQPWEKRYKEISNPVAEIGKKLQEIERPVNRKSPSNKDRRLQEARWKNFKNASLTFETYLRQLAAKMESPDPVTHPELSTSATEEAAFFQRALSACSNPTALVYYLVTSEKLFIIVTTPDRQWAREVTCSSSELARLIRHFRKALHSPGKDPIPGARRLYQKLIMPIAEDLKQAKTETLVVSLDGPLRYIPIAALHDGHQYVVERYEIAVFTPAGRSNLGRPTCHSWQIAGLGVAGSVNKRFRPLPAVAEELDDIVKEDQRDHAGVVPGLVRIDAQFTKKEMTRILSQEKPVIHIASHFSFDPIDNLNSSLLLGDGSLMTLEKFKEENYRFDEVELLTLSACETVLGGQGSNGREVEGFGVLAQSKGAGGVIASLWKVMDKSTGLLMKNMYEIHEQGRKTTKAAALRQAQLRLLYGAGPVSPQDHTPIASAYAHPFFWAPFILMGNWQ